MLRIGICDDRADARFSLRCLLERLAQERGIKFVFYEFHSGEGLLSWLDKHPAEVDVIFLDIEMGGISGMTTAQKIAERPNRPQIVFVTGYADYVFDGYSVGALDYIIKPPKSEKLEGIITRLLTLLYKKEPFTYTVQNVDGLYRIALEDILYFSSDRRLVTLVTAAREYAFYAKLDDVERSLEKGFIRIHRRFLVKILAAEKLKGDFLYVGRHTLPVSRSRRQDTLRALADCIVTDEVNPR